MESFALHSLSTTATSASFSHHPSRLSILRRISPPPTISLPSLPYLRSHSVQPLTFSPRFSKRIASTPKDDTPSPTESYLIESHLQEEDKLIKEARKRFYGFLNYRSMARWFMSIDKNSVHDLMAMSQEDFVEAIFERFRFHRDEFFPEDM